MESKDAVFLQKKDNVYYLCLNKPKANNFNTDFVRQINAQLDIVEKDENICALVTTSSLERFFSTGLDAKFVSNIQHPEDMKNYLIEFCQLLGRLLVFPVPTIALLGGVTIAAGLMFAMAHDYRFIVKDKAWICLNEVDMGFALLPGMNAVIQCKLKPDAFRELFLTGKRMQPEEALDLKIVDFVCERGEIAKVVHEFANQIAEKSAYKENFRALKMEAYYDAYIKATDKRFGTQANSLDRIMSISKL